MLSWWSCASPRSPRREAEWENAHPDADVRTYSGRMSGRERWQQAGAAPQPAETSRGGLGKGSWDSHAKAGTTHGSAKVSVLLGSLSFL